MKTKTLLQISLTWMTSFMDGYLGLPFLLTGHFYCFLSIYFKHSPGLQSWAALPIINALLTFWLLAKSQTKFLNWNE